MFARRHLYIIIIIIMYYSLSPITSVGVLAPICLSVSSMSWQPENQWNGGWGDEWDEDAESSSRGWQSSSRGYRWKQGWGSQWDPVPQGRGGQWGAAPQGLVAAPQANLPAPALPQQPARTPPLPPALPLQVAAAHVAVAAGLAPLPLSTAPTPPTPLNRSRHAWDDRVQVCGNTNSVCRHSTGARSQPAEQERDLDFFKSLRDDLPHKSTHNGVLKFFREVHDTDSSIILDEFMRPCEIAHDLVGPKFKFTEKKFDYSWLTLVAQLCEDDMKKLLTGKNGMLRIVDHCTFEQRPGSSDHASAHNLRDQGASMNRNKMEKVWDFVFYLDDGTKKRLHPEWKGNKVKCFFGTDLPDAVLPKSGAGGSDGKRSFQRQLNLGLDTVMRFHNFCHSCRPPCPPPALPVAKAMPGPPPARPQSPPVKAPPPVRPQGNPQSPDGLITKAPPPPRPDGIFAAPRGRMDPLVEDVE